MAETSAIEWTDSTFNPWIGCTKVSPACDHCYAEVSTPSRTLHVVWGPKEERRRTSASNWNLPLRWNAQHDEFFAKHGRRRRVFCASLADVFDNAVDPAWRIDLFKLIADTPNLDWLLLTKRIGNVRTMCQSDGLMFDMLADRVWLGATIANQQEANRDIPKLLETPARVRFLSMEPLLGPVDLRKVPLPDGDSLGTALDSQCTATGIDWVIVGGESGTHARPMHPDWARGLRDQCAAAGVPFLFKQHGEWMPGSGDFGMGRYETAAVAHDGRVTTGGFEKSGYPADAGSADGWAMVHRAGKKAAGRMLDGKTHDGFPTSSA